MQPINLGTTDVGEDVTINLEQEGIRFILLAGVSGSGKSVFHQHLYREMASKYTPAEIGFILLDMTKGENIGCGPEYMVMPPVTHPEEALEVLENVQDASRTVFIHIEECDLVYRDRARFEKAMERIRNETKNIFIVYSTSRIDPGYLADWLEKYIDMKIVFRVASPLDSQLLLGSDVAFHFREPGEHMIALGDRVATCQPCGVK